MSKTLLLILAFGAVAFAAPGFTPQSNEEDEAPLVEPKIYEELGTDDPNVQVHNNIEKVGNTAHAIAGSAVYGENVDKRNIAKRQAYISYPYSQYRYGYYPQQSYYEPAANGIIYPYNRNLLSYISDFAGLY